MNNRAILLVILSLSFLFEFQTFAFSEMGGIDPRDVVLDRALGGMEEGSRVLSPQGGVHPEAQRTHATRGSRVGSDVGTHPVTAAASQAGLKEANHGVFAHGSSGSETGLAGNSHFGGSSGVGTEVGGSSGGGQESKTGNGSEGSIIEVNADANLDTDNPSAGGDVTINPDAGGGLLDANTETTTNTGGQESTNSEQNSIIEANVDTNLSGGSPAANADVGIDPNASGGLVDAEAATSTDLVEQELVSNTGLQVDNGANTTAAETTSIGTETGSTAVPAANEVEGGVEAEVEGTGAGDDIECNEADGLPCPPKL